MNKLKRLIAIMTILVVIMSTTSVAFAGVFDDEYDESKYGEYLGAECKLNDNGTLELSDRIKAIVDSNSAGGTETVEIIIDGDSSPAISITADGAAKLRALARDIYDKESIKSRVQQMSDGFNVSADTEQAGKMMSGIEPLVSLLVGVITYGVVLGLTLFTAFDICYLTMPVFRNKTEEMKQSGNGMMVKTDNKTGETKLRWVTDEAQHAVMVCSIESGKNPLGVYLKKRIWAYIMVAIVIYILISGNITLLVSIAINFVSGVLDALSDLGR